MPDRASAIRQLSIDISLFNRLNQTWHYICVCIIEALLIDIVNNSGCKCLINDSLIRKPVMDKKQDVVIIGGGPAGRTIVHMLNAAEKNLSITLIKDEPVNVNRCAVPYGIDGKKPIENIRYQTAWLQTLEQVCSLTL